MNLIVSQLKVPSDHYPHYKCGNIPAITDNEMRSKNSVSGSNVYNGLT